jgi:hypothetical protein
MAGKTMVSSHGVRRAEFAILIGRRNQSFTRFAWIDVSIASIGMSLVTACCTPAMIAVEAEAKLAPNGGAIIVGMIFSTNAE